MKLVDTTCPKCGANLRIDADREKVFCEYCGAQVLIDNEVQHIQYDNVEQAGYEFEKGRQRAKKEASMQNQSNNAPATPPKEKNNTLLWVLGWIFFFPAPVMVLIWRKKNTWDVKMKLLVTAVFWIAIFAIGSIGNKQSPETTQTKDTTAVTVAENTDTAPVDTGKNENKEQTTATEIKEAALDHTGLWVQKDRNESYMTAIIKEEGRIGVFFILEGDDTPYTYWVGTYDAPTEATDKYSWTSESTYAGNGILASSDDNKEFLYEKGEIKYTVTIQGESKEISLVREDWDTSKIPDSAFGSVKMNSSTTEFKSLEVTESDWYVSKSGYLHYYVKLYNPNKDIAVEFPSYRITARDKDGALIGTDDMVLSLIHADDVFVFGSQAFSVDETPATVEFEPLEPKDYNLKTENSLEEYKQLEVVNGAAKSDKIVGEVYNPNNYDLDQVRVMAVCRNADGELIAIESTFIKDVKAGGNTPFSMSMYSTGNVASAEFYANQW